MSIEKAQGLTLPHNIPENARRALTLAGMIEKAGAGELAPKDMKEALEFCTLVSSGLVHLSHYTLELVGAIRESDPPVLS